MLVSDLLHSCANDFVAEAAVCSIGGDFACAVESEAAEGGVSVGFFTSKIVREFAVAANERDWRELVNAVRGQDHPVLAGLRLIVASRLHATADARSDGLALRRACRATAAAVAAA